ncbi:host cell division inhibitor Icd-like protein [Proteus mirabilis]|uniref:host cell division inhibitor Icd-like protein n=1 Tax=Proteus terrae TaxID=1574161 RepID=UPI0018C784FF|nr:host cell division inhibitor Icd-like protein [Proteus terrae]EJD6329647.1 ash family protein [Proteus mirabilis]EJD6392467.1 ash family protein [Proteus mirabilis]MBG5998630.1 ash family protein [Proteus mirabilis]WCG86912.1 host cell division inhibitor Icd-like protein [Proteus terrae]
MITLYLIKGIAYQVNDSLLAGNNVSTTYTTTNTVALNYGITGNQSAKIYANQSGKYFSGCKSGEYLSAPKRGNAKRGEFTPFAKGEKNHLCKGQKSAILQGLIGVTTRDRIEFFESIKKECCRNSDDYHLRLLLNVGYSEQALAKSSVRICTLNILKVTHDAPSVFFCVYAYAHPRFAVLYRPNSTVMLAGQPKGWLVSFSTSSANPVSVTTPIEICTSGGDSLDKLKEIIVMMATPTQTQFKFLFLSIKRSDTTAQPCRITITAPNEHDARLMLVRDYILAFAGRVPVQGVAA